jgi:hypothetical protein
MEQLLMRVSPRIRMALRVHPDVVAGCGALGRVAGCDQLAGFALAVVPDPADLSV